MLNNLKKSLAAFALMAVSVMTPPAHAGDTLETILDVAAAVANNRDGRRGDRVRDHGYGERWLCQTQSRGYRFRAEGRSYDEANYNVVNLCMQHPYGTLSECRYAVQCQQLGQGGGYPHPQPHPYPQPQPRKYTCQTFGGGRWHQAQHPHLEKAQRRAVRQCQQYPYSRPPECERNLRCGY